MKKILVIVAHPDDEVLGMGGTIARLTSEGKEVNVLIVTDGSSAQYREKYNLNDIIIAKKEETRECNNILGVKKVYYGNLPDMRLDTVPHIDINKLIETHINLLKPDTVFTHFWGDINLDHQIIFKSTLVAVRPFQEHIIKTLYCFKVPSSTEWTPNKADTIFMPNTFVDISKFTETKYTAFEKYSTELRDYPHPRSIRHLRESDIVSGLRMGMSAIEEFILLREII